MDEMRQLWSERYVISLNLCKVELQLKEYQATELISDSLGVVSSVAFAL